MTSLWKGSWGIRDGTGKKTTPEFRLNFFKHSQTVKTIYFRTEDELAQLLDAVGTRRPTTAGAGIEGQAGSIRQQERERRRKGWRWV